MQCYLHSAAKRVPSLFNMPRTKSTRRKAAANSDDDVDMETASPTKKQAVSVAVRDAPLSQSSRSALKFSTLLIQSNGRPIANTSDLIKHLKVHIITFLFQVV